MLLISVLERQRQVATYEVEDSLVYKMSLRIVKATQINSVSKI